jgi:hypothetical protein
MKTYTQSTDNLHRHDDLWKRAIEEAEVEVQKARSRTRRLRESIRTFKKMLERGEPWPGQKTSTQN